MEKIYRNLQIIKKINKSLELKKENEKTNVVKSVDLLWKKKCIKSVWKIVD